jgi:hypothetical protein
MRQYLTGQMHEKKHRAKDEKKVEDQQLDMWNKENREYFDKEKHTNDRVS